MKNVTKELNSFAEFLKLSWEVFNSSLDGKDRYEIEEYLEIIVQANWELLVEMKICDDIQVLDYYASGADLFSLSSRVISPEKNGNSRIIAYSDYFLTDHFSGKKIKPDKLDFFQFVRYDGNQYFVQPPFDMSLVENIDGDKFLFKNKELEYFLANNA